MRLAKRTSNLFRARDATPTPRPRRRRLRPASLDVDPEARTADVLGMTTYEDLVDATLPHGLMPLVVPAAARPSPSAAPSPAWASSRRRSATACRTSRCSSSRSSPATAGSSPPRPTASTPTCSHGFPNSYGSPRLRAPASDRARAGPALRRPAPRAVRRPDAGSRRDRRGHAQPRAYDGEPVDFLDGVVFSRDESYLTLGRSPTPRRRRVRATTPGNEIYYRSVQQRAARRPHGPRLPLALGHRLVLVLARLRRAAPAGPPAVAQRRLLRSDVYWKIVALREPARRHGAARPRGAAGRRARRSCRTSRSRSTGRRSSSTGSFARSASSPVWMCPRCASATAGRATWELYALDPDDAPTSTSGSGRPSDRAREADGDAQPADRGRVADLGGRKSLYSDAVLRRGRVRRALQRGGVRAG